MSGITARPWRSPACGRRGRCCPARAGPGARARKSAAAALPRHPPRGRARPPRRPRPAHPSRARHPAPPRRDPADPRGRPGPAPGADGDRALGPCAGEPDRRPLPRQPAEPAGRSRHRWGPEYGSPRVAWCRARQEQGKGAPHAPTYHARRRPGRARGHRRGAARRAHATVRARVRPGAAAADSGTTSRPGRGSRAVQHDGHPRRHADRRHRRRPARAGGHRHRQNRIAAINAVDPAQLHVPRPPLNADHEIDATGQYVTPGFIDLHVHAGGPPKNPEAEYPYKLWLAHGVTTVRGVPLADFGITARRSSAAPATRSSRRASSTTRGPRRAGTRGRSATTPTKARAWIRWAADHGADGFKLRDPECGSPAVTKALLSEARKQHLGSTMHLAQICIINAGGPDKINALIAAREGLGTVTHFYGHLESLLRPGRSCSRRATTTATSRCASARSPTGRQDLQARRPPLVALPAPAEAARHGVRPDVQHLRRQP